MTTNNEDAELIAELIKQADESDKVKHLVESLGEGDPIDYRNVRREAADRIAALTAELSQFKIDGGKAIQFNKQRADDAEQRAEKAEAEVARLSADAKPVAWMWRHVLRDGSVASSGISNTKVSPSNDTFWNGGDIRTEVTPLYDRPAAPSAEPTEEIVKAAQAVVWFDWSDNDEDAVAAIERLRKAAEALAASGKGAE